MSVHVRPAVVDDVEAIHRLVVELALYEREPDAVDASADHYRRALFTDAPQVFAHVAVDGDEIVGCAIWFLSFSTWTGTHGLYLEDLVVTESARGRGVGRLLLAELAAICVARGYHRLEWSVLDWNADALGFYRSLGAVAQPEWVRYRVDGAPLTALASIVRSAADPGR